MAFFITYIILQPFMIIVARKIGPRWFLPTCVFLWGCLTIGAGFSPNWETLLGVRLILGVLESGFFPSCTYRKSEKGRGRLCTQIDWRF